MTFWNAEICVRVGLICSAQPQNVDRRRTYVRNGVVAQSSFLAIGKEVLAVILSRGDTVPVDCGVPRRKFVNFNSVGI